MYVEYSRCGAYSFNQHSMDEIEIVVLAGGKSSRMGQDKGLMPLLGRSMIQYVINTAEEVGCPIRIVANDSSYIGFGYPVVSDIFPEKGPLGGLYTALMTSQAKYVLLLSCDTPMITRALLTFLITNVADKEILVSSVQERLFPLLAIYRKDLAPEILPLISTNRLKMQSFIRSRNYQELDIKDFVESNSKILANINTLADFNDIQGAILL